MEADIMRVLETFEKTLNQVEKDTGNLRSDTHDIKIELGVMKEQLNQLKVTVDKLNNSVFGNGKKGFDAQMIEMKADVDDNTEFRRELKAEFRKFIWAAIGLLVGNLLLNLIGL